MSVLVAALAVLLLGTRLSGAELPSRYFRPMEAGLAGMDTAPLPAEPEAQPRGHFYPGALPAAAALYAKAHAAKSRYGYGRLLELAFKLGDLPAAEGEGGTYLRRNDQHRDSYMGPEADRLLDAKLGEGRRARWRQALLKLIREMAAEVGERKDRPAYTSPLGVSVNHTALRASTVHLAGVVFGREEWKESGAAVMHRYAAAQPSGDGYWGEHSQAGPTTAYDYLTSAGVARYFEHSQDPAAVPGLRRSTDFHQYFTCPDGQPVMVIDDRRRHAYESPWAHFGFSRFADGRRYAEFLTAALQERPLSMEHLGRPAQNALYYHEGPTDGIPEEPAAYLHRMKVPAGIRKTGPWVVCLSGLISTQAVTSQYYLDRQGHLGIFHERAGLIISGANSKRQPEPATFWERIPAGLFHLPLDSRLEMGATRDRLTPAYNTFCAELEVEPPAEGRPAYRFPVHRKSVSEGARLTWSVYLYNPDRNGPETELGHAVGAVSVPLALGNRRSQEMAFLLEAPRETREEAWRRQVKAVLFVPDPLPALLPQTHSRFRPAPGVVAERITYGTQFGMRVPAILYLPEARTGKVPALIVVNGHGGDKYSWYAFYSGVLYARAGAAVLTYDPAGEGERNRERKSGTRAHDQAEPPRELAQRLSGLMITDVMQAVSYLSQRPEVDPERIAAAGYSMGSFVLSVACAVDSRLKGCVLVGGGNLDGPGQYWDNSKPMCQGIPYQSLMFLGDRPAVLYALHAARGPTLVYNGLEDSTVGIPADAEAFFRDLQRRAAAVRGSAEGIFEFGLMPGVGHRPFFVTRPVALWLERQLDFPNWTEQGILAMEETHIGAWAEEHGVALDPLYASEHREGGVRALGAGAPALSREDLSVLRPAEWERRKAQFVHEAWLEKARALAGPR